MSFSECWVGSMFELHWEPPSSRYAKLTISWPCTALAFNPPLKNPGSWNSKLVNAGHQQVSWVCLFVLLPTNDWRRMIVNPYWEKRGWVSVFSFLLTMCCCYVETESERLILKGTNLIQINVQLIMFVWNKGATPRKLKKTRLSFWVWWSFIKDL